MAVERFEDSHYLRVAAVAIVFTRNNVNTLERFGAEAFFGNGAALLKRIERFKRAVFN
jgi:ABC-type transporter Mla maintaining outer membrane lipid asymmetry permease subunit MlaE